MIYFRLPFGEKILTTDDDSTKNWIHFVSFDRKNKIKVPGNIVEVNTKNLNLNFTLFKQNPAKSDSKEDYLNKISAAINLIKEENLDKLVLSRKILVPYNTIDLKRSFLNLCDNYPNAFCYIFNENNVCWIGAFSELLGKFDKKNGEFKTMSLAGTLPLRAEWTRKEIEEQKTVTDYISHTLKYVAGEVLQSETYSHESGNIKHLRTDFSCYISENQLDKLIEDLHPTPAVCGIPKDICRAAIQKFESYSRELYSGYSRIEFAENIYYFVTLRCAKILQNRIEIFAGGGITKDSNPEREWQETELKAGAILKNLVIS